jgi:hypothetical protein
MAAGGDEANITELPILSHPELVVKGGPRGRGLIKLALRLPGAVSTLPPLRNARWLGSLPVGVDIRECSGIESRSFPLPS